MTDKRPTISDVARQTGVSKATVSAVLNDSDAVGSDTRDRVLAAIELLNYRPTQQSGVRAATRFRSIALVIKEHDNPYYDEVTAGVRAFAETQGYMLFVVSSEGSYASEKRAVELLREKGVDGLIAAPVMDEHADLSHFYELKRRNYPFVFLEQVRGVPASLVDLENVSASQKAVEYLFSLGHRRVAHFAGPQYSLHSEERADGVRRAYSSTHLVLAPEDIIDAGAHFDDGYRCGRELLESRSRDDWPTAITCYNDLVAMGLVKAIIDLGLKVPDDVSVIGFDDIKFSEIFLVPLTTVRVPKLEMGSRAAQMLIDHIESRQAVTPQRHYLEATLIVRASTGPP
ncbi:MAG TPA: LacI family DNA-binding transcriptional regulator [Gemmatimonadaceae bacterium]|jgi:LacI family transcriptional regulator/LacI family repressor for deo operon, udp, cdd, tsx, nupC, and nupG|nr:LacI family DNA-binding transcriptional regulator [Gemmatimonadaceae bacterium]